MIQPKAFPGQKEDEKIEVFLRRHWISFLPSLLIVMVFLLIPLAAFLTIKIAKINLSEFWGLTVLAFSTELLIAFAFFIASFIDYYLDVSIVTNQRIIDIEQKGLFNRSISQQELVRVQDVKTKKKGVLQTFFDYGDVFIQTAGESPNFLFQNIPKPNEVAQKIMELHHNILAQGYPESKKSQTTNNLTDDLKEIPRL